MITTAFRALLRQKGRGYLESPEDARDQAYAYKLTGITTPAAAMDMCRAVLHRNQGSTSSCVAHAIDHGVQGVCALDRGPKRGLMRREYTLRSVAAPYRTARELAGVENVDGGCYLRDGLKAWAHLGSPADAVRPLRIATINRANGAACYRDGHPWRGLRYSSLGRSARAVREALANGRPVVGGWLVDEAFLRNDGPSTIGAFDRLTVGGHAMCILGYDHDKFRVRNSWGEDWRDFGWFWGTDEFVEDARELWCLEGWS